MLEAIHENHLMYQELKKAIIKERQLRERNEIAMVIFILIITALVLFIICLCDRHKTIVNCINDGNTQEYCEYIADIE